MPISAHRLDQYRLQSDPIADTTVKALHDQLDSKAIWKWYQQFISELETPDYQTLPQPLAAFFEHNQQLPAWLDQEQVRQAEQLFLDIGPLYAVCLLLRSLPIGYSSLKVVKVLTSTGYLSRDVKQGTAKRILETTQFVLNVMRKDTFTPNSSGIKHTLKVRFLHAMIRYHLLKHDWDTTSYGIPINQEDMAETILTFSVGSIKGLDRLNAGLSMADKDALVHYWAIIGVLIGVEEALLPRDFKTGEQVYEQILDRQSAPSEDGQLLTRALCNFGRGFLPVKHMPMLPEYLITYLIDNPKYSDAIGIHGPRSAKDKLLFASMMRSVRLLNSHKQNKLIAGVTRRMNNVFANNLKLYFDTEFDLKLIIPKEIKAAWKLKY